MASRSVVISNVTIEDRAVRRTLFDVALHYGVVEAITFNESQRLAIITFARLSSATQMVDRWLSTSAARAGAMTAVLATSSSAVLEIPSSPPLSLVVELEDRRSMPLLEAKAKANGLQVRWTDPIRVREGVLRNQILTACRAIAVVSPNSATKGTTQGLVAALSEAQGHTEGVSKWDEAILVTRSQLATSVVPIREELPLSALREHSELKDIPIIRKTLPDGTNASVAEVPVFSLNGERVPVRIVAGGGGQGGDTVTIRITSAIAESISATIVDAPVPKPTGAALLASLRGRGLGAPSGDAGRGGGQMPTPVAESASKPEPKPASTVGVGAKLLSALKKKNEDASTATSGATAGEATAEHLKQVAGVPAPFSNHQRVVAIVQNTTTAGVSVELRHGDGTVASGLVPPALTGTPQGVDWSGYFVQGESIRVVPVASLRQDRRMHRVVCSAREVDVSASAEPAVDGSASVGAGNDDDAAAAASAALAGASLTMKCGACLRLGAAQLPVAVFVSVVSSLSAKLLANPTIGEQLRRAVHVCSGFTELGQTRSIVVGSLSSLSVLTPIVAKDATGTQGSSHTDVAAMAAAILGTAEASSEKKRQRSGTTF